MSSFAINTPSQVPQGLSAPIKGFERPAPTGEQVADAKQLREAFTQFVGTTVFGQMLSSMRKTVGEPAYFHGGQAEKVFQSQLDQQLATELTTAGGSSFAESLFERQFPDAAHTLKQSATVNETNNAPTALDQLAALPRV